jgi:hypothetical protein
VFAGPVDQSPIYAEMNSAGHEGPDFVFVQKNNFSIGQ